MIPALPLGRRKADYSLLFSLMQCNKQPATAFCASWSIGKSLPEEKPQYRIPDARPFTLTEKVQKSLYPLWIVIHKRIICIDCTRLLRNKSVWRDGVHA